MATFILNYHTIIHSQIIKNVWTATKKKKKNQCVNTSLKYASNSNSLTNHMVCKQMAKNMSTLKLPTLLLANLIA